MYFMPVSSVFDTGDLFSTMLNAVVRALGSLQTLTDVLGWSLCSFPLMQFHSLMH
jgi:hypothetical protein